MKHINKIIIFILVSLTTLSWAVPHFVGKDRGSDNLVGVIHKDGIIYKKINLTGAAAEDLKITDNNGHFNIVEVNNGKLRIKEANCPEKICVNAGWLSKPGQIAVCMPHRLKVVVEGAPEGIDASSY